MSTDYTLRSDTVMYVRRTDVPNAGIQAADSDQRTDYIQTGRVTGNWELVGFAPIGGLSTAPPTHVNVSNPPWTDRTTLKNGNALAQILHYVIGVQCTDLDLPALTQGSTQEELVQHVRALVQEVSMTRPLLEELQSQCGELFAAMGLDPRTTLWADGKAKAASMREAEENAAALLERCQTLERANDARFWGGREKEDALRSRLPAGVETFTDLCGKYKLVVEELETARAKVAKYLSAETTPAVDPNRPDASRPGIQTPHEHEVAELKREIAELKRSLTSSNEEVVRLSGEIVQAKSTYVPRATDYELERIAITTSGHQSVDEETAGRMRHMAVCVARHVRLEQCTLAALLELGLVAATTVENGHLEVRIRENKQPSKVLFEGRLLPGELLPWLTGKIYAIREKRGILEIVNNGPKVLV